MVRVESSNIAGLEYNSEDQTLIVEFVSGPLYIFWPIPEYLYLEVLGSDSVGKSFNRLIRGKYSCERITED